MSKAKFRPMINIKRLTEIIERLTRNDLSPDVIEIIHNMLVKSELNSNNLERCDSLSLQKEPGNSTLDAEHDRNHKSLENNDRQILIQIPKNLKVSSIQIQFEQEKVQHRVSSLASRF